MFSQQLYISNRDEVEYVCVLEESMEAERRELIDSRLREFELRLGKLIGKVTTVHGTDIQPSTDGGPNRVQETHDSHARQIPTSVPLTTFKFQSNCRSGNNNNNNNV
jgi:hypothetical protein